MYSECTEIRKFLQGIDTQSLDDDVGAHPTFLLAREKDLSHLMHTPTPLNAPP